MILPAMLSDDRMLKINVSLENQLFYSNSIRDRQSVGILGPCIEIHTFWLEFLNYSRKKIFLGNFWAWILRISRINCSVILYYLYVLKMSDATDWCTVHCHWSVVFLSGCCWQTSYSGGIIRTLLNTSKVQEEEDN